MKKLRKFLTIGVMVLSIIAMSGLTVAPASAAAQAGDLIKMDGLSSVYYLSNDGKRYVFPSESVYFSWYQDFSSVVTIPASELQSYPLGANVTMRPGTKLVKITTDPSVYAVTGNGVLRKIQSEADAITLFGSNWNKIIVDVADSFFTNYTVGTPLTSGQYPAGTLLKNANNASVYYFDGTNYRLIASESAFNANRFNWNNVVTTTMTITASGSALTGAESIAYPTGGVGTVITGSGLSVALSGNTAPSTTLIAGQALAPLASFNFTAASDGAVVIKTLKLKRIGISSDSALSNVYLYEGNTKLTDNASLGSGYVTFSNGSGIITVPAGSTKTITVMGDVAGTTGNIGMQIESASNVLTTAGNVSGAFPMSGNLMSMTTAADLATVAIGALTTSGGTINAGTMNATLWSAPFQVTNKAVDLKYVSFKQVGSIAADAIQNLSLYINGVKAGNSASISSDNRVIFDLTSAPVRLSTGSATIDLRGDIVKGSSRTFSFAIQTASDVVVTDTNYNVNIAATGAGLNDSDSTTINSGTVSISADSTFATTEVIKNASNVTFMKYTMKAFGENVKINSLTVAPTLTSATSTDDVHVLATEGIDDLAIFVNGAQVGSSQSFRPSTTVTAATGTSATFTADKVFGTSNLFTIEAGQTVTVEIRGTLNLDANTDVTDVQADLKVLANKFEGVSSFNTSPTSGSTYAGRNLDIVSGNLSVSKNIGLQDQIVAKNMNQVKIGSYILKAGSSEGIRVTNLRVDLTLGGTASTLNNFANLTITDGTTPVMPQAQNNFPVNYTIAANQTKTVDVFVDLGDLANGVTVATDLSVTGVSTPSNTSVSVLDRAGQTMTVNTGTIADPVLVNNTPVAKLVNSGATNELIATYKFVATNSTVKVDQIKFKVTKNDGSTDNETAIQSLTVNNVSAPVINNGTDYVVDLNGLNLSVPAGTQGLNVEVKANFNNVTSANQGGSVTNNDVKIILTDYKYIVGNTTTTDNGSNVASNVMVLVATSPTFALASDNPTGQTSGFAGGQTDMLKFTVTNGGATSMNLRQVALKAIYSTGVTFGTNDVQVLDSSNNVLGSVVTVATSSEKFGVKFTNDYAIAAGQTATFTVRADVASLGDNDSVRIDLAEADADLATAVTAANLLTTTWGWNDGTIAEYMNGFLFKNLPLAGKPFVK